MDYPVRKCSGMTMRSKNLIIQNPEASFEKSAAAMESITLICSEWVKICRHAVMVL